MSTNQEVNFQNEVEISFEYNFECFNAIVGFTDGNLCFRYLENSGVMSGAEVVVNKNAYNFNSNNLEFEGETDKLPDGFLPKIMFRFITDNNGVIKADSYDNSKACFYSEDSCLSSFIRFEVYENNDNVSYAMIIT